MADPFGGPRFVRVAMPADFHCEKTRQPPPPIQTRNFTGMGVFQQKELQNLKRPTPESLLWSHSDCLGFGALLPITTLGRTTPYKLPELWGWEFPKPGCFKPGCLQFLFFCALLGDGRNTVSTVLF